MVVSPLRKEKLSVRTIPETSLPSVVVSCTVYFTWTCAIEIFYWRKMLSRESFIFCQVTLERSTWKGHVHKCYTGIGNLLCLNSKVFSKVVNNLNWNCKYLHFECLWILAGLNVLLWPLISYMELMTMRNVTYRIKVSWSLWINVSKIFAFVYSTNTQCKFLLHLRWLLCWKEEAVHFRLNAINNVFFCVTDPQIRCWKCVVVGRGEPLI